MAVLTATLAVAFLLIAALVVELGLARDTRRQAQASADAAALAAVNALWDSGVADVSAAVEEAEDYAAANFGTTDADWAACRDSGRVGQFADFVPVAGNDCISFRGSPHPTEVRVVVPRREVDTPLGALAGVSSVQVGAEAHAGAKPPVLQLEGGLRPWGVCSKVAAPATHGQVVFAPMKGGSTTRTSPNDGCGDEGPPGGWWVAQCVGQGNGNGATEAAVLNGCSTAHDYRPVQGQTMTDPKDLRKHLTAACPKKSENSTCLSSDPGNNFHNASDEWQTLVGKNFQMPVFCFPEQCDEGAYSGQGNNGAYAIHAIATVELCGFEFPPRAASTNWPTSGPCATSNPENFVSSDVISGSGLFIVVKELHYGVPSKDWKLELPPELGGLTR